MLTLALLLAAIGQSLKSGGEATVHNEAGDRFSIPAFSSESILQEFVKLTEARDQKGVDRLVDGSHARQLWPGTKVQCISIGGGDRIEVRPSDGPSRGMQLFVLAKNLKAIDPKEVEARERAEEARRAREAEEDRREAERARRTWAAARAARGPIDPALVAKDLRDAISQATAASFRKRNASIGRDRLIGMAVEEVRLRHVLEPGELLKVANDAKVFVHAGGKTFDVLGRPLRERLGEGR